MQWGSHIQWGPLGLHAWQEWSLGFKLALDSVCVSLSVNLAVVSFGVTFCWK